MPANLKRTVAVVLFLGWPGFAAVSRGGESAASNDVAALLMPWLNYRYSVTAVNSLTVSEPADSTLNPGNTVLNIPARIWDHQLRMDFNAETGPLSVLVKPRLDVQNREWKEGIQDGESEAHVEAYINEWQARLSLRDQMFLSYGRENLQWGPGFIFSPSNPFIQDNGQLNPKGEVPGLDYAKLLWVPGGGWSVSLIANVGEGRANLERNGDQQYNVFADSVNAASLEALESIESAYRAGLEEIDDIRGIFPPQWTVLNGLANRLADRLAVEAAEQRNAGVTAVKSQSAAVLNEADLERDSYNLEFRNAYALKLDYTSMKKYATVLTSYRETGNENDIRCLRLGGYAGVTATDAILLYGEANASLRGDESYPVADPTAPFGTRMERTRQTEDDFKGSVLVGGSYTFEGGHTVAAEYLYNGPGYSDAQAGQYNALRDEAAAGLAEPEPYRSFAYAALGQAADPGLFFIRRNYLLLQYQQMQIAGDLGVIVRCTFNLDDGSAQLLPVAQYNLTDRWQVFALGNKNFGSRDTEFRSRLDHFYQLGVQASF